MSCWTWNSSLKGVWSRNGDIRQRRRHRKWTRLQVLNFSAQTSFWKSKVCRTHFRQQAWSETLRTSVFGDKNTVYLAPSDPSLMRLHGENKQAKARHRRGTSRRERIKALYLFIYLFLTKGCFETQQRKDSNLLQTAFEKPQSDSKLHSIKSPSERRWKNKLKTIKNECSYMRPLPQYLCFIFLVFFVYFLA